MPGKYTNAAMAAAEAKEAAAQAGLGDDTTNSSNANSKSSKNVFARFTLGGGGGRDRGGSDGDAISRVESDYDPSILSGYTGMTGASGAGTAYSEVSESVISDADYTRSTLGGGDDGTAGGYTVESDTYGAASGYSRSPPASPTTRARSSATERRGTGRNRMHDEDEDDRDRDHDHGRDGGDGAGGDRPRIRRYRGFSTSISSLFLDESLVCGAISCFGLILSQRSEHLLNVRNEARGLVQHGGNGRKSGAIRKPSKVVGLALIVTLVGMAATYAYWGFGNKYEGSSGISSYYDFFDDGYDGGASAGDDVYYANDDAAAAGGNANDDDAAGDDRYHNQNMYYGDDKWRNNNNNAYAADDDGGNNYAANDDAAAAGDDQYYNRYNGNRRDLEDSSWSTTTQPHNIGICKVRDAQHYLWQSLYGLLDDTVREQQEQRTVEGQKHPDQPRMLQYDYENAGPRVVDHGTWIRLGLGIAFFVVLGLIGRRRRMRTRYEILRARAQDDHLFYSSSVGGNTGMDEEVENGREDKYEGACSHTLCGCYPVDENLPEDDDDDDDDDYGGADDDTFAHIANDTNPGKKIRKNRKGTDCMARFFSCVSACCCGWICKIWIQCFSICALAQEGREVRLLLPPRLQRVDILTHQPWYEYYRDIYNLRLKWMAQNRDKIRNARSFEIGPHFRALSQLSRIMITLFITCTIAIVLVLQFNPRATFDWGDGFILVATFLQSFIVLFIVHWIFHKSDLSFDAVVKFYASGFLIATPTAFIAEGILINIMLFVAYTLYAIGAVIWEEDFLDWFSQNYVPFWIAGELLNAFIVAAITEELCKYYAFRFVEHPDLIFLTGLDRARQDSDHLIGGEKNYAFNSHVVSSDLHTGSEFDLDRSVAAGFSQKKNMHRGKRTQAHTAMSKSLNPDDTGTDEEEVRSIRQRAAAVTTAMIGTAVGLACAENFLYVFMFGGAHSGTEEMAILIFRSIFPIHALAAAMQSIGVIRKFLEGPGDRDAGRLGVGKIIFPAVLLHGTFDAILMSVNVYIESSWDFYMRKNNGEVAEGFVPYNSFVVNLVVWIAICVTMFAGLVWYTMKNREQKKRLASLEDTEDRVMELANMGDGGRKSPRTYVNPTLGGNADGDGGGEFV